MTIPATYIYLLQHTYEYKIVPVEDNLYNILGLGMLNYSIFCFSTDADNLTNLGDKSEFREGLAYYFQSLCFSKDHHFFVDDRRAFGNNQGIPTL